MHQCDNEDMPQKDTIIHLTVLPCLSDRTRADIRADLLEKMQTAAGTEKDALQAVLSAVDSRNELPGLDARLVHALRLHYLDGQPWGCVAQYLADPGIPSLLEALTGAGEPLIARHAELQGRMLEIETALGPRAVSWDGVRLENHRDSSRMLRILDKKEEIQAEMDRLDPYVSLYRQACREVIPIGMQDGLHWKERDRRYRNALQAL